MLPLPHVRTIKDKIQEVVLKAEEAEEANLREEIPTAKGRRKGFVTLGRTLESALERMTAHVSMIIRLRVTLPREAILLAGKSKVEERSHPFEAVEEKERMERSPGPRLVIPNPYPASSTLKVNVLKEVIVISPMINRLLLVAQREMEREKSKT